MYSELCWYQLPGLADLVSYTICHHWGKLGDGYMELLCAIFAASWESMIWVYNFKMIGRKKSVSDRRIHLSRSLVVGQAR